MAPSSQPPYIVIIGLPDLAAPLRAVGYRVVSEASPSETAAAARKLAASGDTYVVIAAAGDPATLAWSGVQASSGHKVLLARSEKFPAPNPPQGTRVVDLPATVDEMMGVFGAPPRGGMVGSAVVDVDGSVGGGPTPLPLTDSPSPQAADTRPTREAPPPVRPTPPRPAPPVEQQDAPERRPDAAIVPIRPTVVPSRPQLAPSSPSARPDRPGVAQEDRWPDEPVSTVQVAAPPRVDTSARPEPADTWVADPAPTPPAPVEDRWDDSPAPSTTSPKPPADDLWGTPEPVELADDPWADTSARPGPADSWVNDPAPTHPEPVEDRWDDSLAPSAPSPKPPADDLWDTPEPAEVELADDPWADIPARPEPADTWVASPAPTPPAPADDLWGTPEPVELANDPWADTSARPEPADTWVASPAPTPPAPVEDRWGTPDVAGDDWEDTPPPPAPQTAPESGYWDPFGAAVNGPPEPAPVPTQRPAPPAARTAPVPGPAPTAPVAPPVFQQPAPTPMPEQLDPYASALTHQADTSRTKLSPVVVSFGGKGGVSKTTSAVHLAYRASEVGGLKVTLIDLSRGQGDIRHYLRVGQASLPSVYDAALSGDPKRAISTPDQVTGSRKPGLPEVSFGVALAPSDTQGDPNFVTAEVYRQVVAYARENSDLVVVDTQIVESHDTSGLIDGVVVPLLLAPGGWAVGLSDASVPGVQNLIRRLRSFDAVGIGPTRMMTAFSRIPHDTAFDETQVRALLDRYATHVGTVHVSAEIEASVGRGQFPSDPELDEVVDRVLAKVTGIAAFDPAPTSSRKRGRKSNGKPKERRGLFGRRG